MHPAPNRAGGPARDFLSALPTCVSGIAIPPQRFQGSVNSPVPPASLFLCFLRQTIRMIWVCQFGVSFCILHLNFTLVPSTIDSSG